MSSPYCLRSPMFSKCPVCSGLPGFVGSMATMVSLALFFLLALCFAQPAHAALKAKSAAATVEEATNPQPAATDLTLPMPCNAVMVFKPVAIEAEGFLWDLQTMFGCDDCEREGNDYYERRYSTSISGPFTAQDLPRDWQGKLGAGGNGQLNYYVIGKYEVSNFQWKAIMEGWCPSDSSPLSADDAKPKVNISWYDGQEFARKYTEWLLANAPDSLPHFANDSKNIGYLRLPTESEWEYAARGGHMVPRASLREQSFFPMETGMNHGNYAVFRSESTIAENAEGIGSRKPNPLGVYDTAGNVAEMVLDSFHFSVGGRLHGAAGGFVRKGGSYLTTLGSIMPGRREEVAFFQAEGPTYAKDLGVRMALSGINTPAGDRPSILEKEWAKAGEGQGLLMDQGKNPLEELDRIIAKTTSSTEKKNLELLRLVLKDNNIALERQNVLAAEGLIRSSLFMVETVRNYGVRHKMFINMITTVKRERATAEKEMGKKAPLADFDKDIANYVRNSQSMAQSLFAAVDFYRTKVDESQNFPEPLFTNILERVGKELTGDDLLTENMRKAHAIYKADVDALRKNKRSSLTREAIVKDILPENLWEGLPLGR